MSMAVWRSAVLSEPSASPGGVDDHPDPAQILQRGQAQLRESLRRALGSQTVSITSCNSGVAMRPRCRSRRRRPLRLVAVERPDLVEHGLDQLVLRS